MPVLPVSLMEDLTPDSAPATAGVQSFLTARGGR
jgi:hypothetical protein